MEETLSKYYDSGLFGAFGVSYSGVDINVANEINRTLSGLFDRYGIEKFGGIVAPAGNTKLGKMIERAKAAYSPVRNVFMLNRK